LPWCAARMERLVNNYKDIEWGWDVCSLGIDAKHVL
jgi:hypothetical protein